MDIRPPDCICDGIAPWCSVCVVQAAAQMRREHPESLTVSMLRRRIPAPSLTGREASYLVEMSKCLLTGSLPMEALREERRLAAPRALELSAGPAPVVVSYTEAQALEVIRDRPGITRRELGEALNVSTSAARHRVQPLIADGDVREDGSWPHRLYPTHDKPIGKVEPRQMVRRR